MGKNISVLIDYLGEQRIVFVLDFKIRGDETDEKVEKRPVAFVSRRGLFGVSHIILMFQVVVTLLEYLLKVLHKLSKHHRLLLFIPVHQSKASL